MIRASLILITAIGLCSLLRKRSAAERHIVLATAIIAAAILPALMLIVPSWNSGLADRLAGALPTISTRAAGTTTSAPGIVFRVVALDESPSAAGYVWMIVWLAGSAGCLSFVATGIAKRRRLTSRSREVERLRRIRVLMSPDAFMPMTWGFLNPRLLLPDSIHTWSDERRRAVIAHELAHVSRADWLFQTIAHIACAVYWFNPLFWIAANRLHRESEQACDDAVINLGVHPHDYASHLFAVARAMKRSDGLWASTLAMARRSNLEKRFAALLDEGANRRAVSRTTLGVVVAAALFVLVPLAAITISAPRIPSFDGITVPPKVDQYTSPPLYSDEGRGNTIEGIATLDVSVGKDGSVKRVQVVKGLGYGLDENASLAVRDWRFVPARRNGTPVEATTRVEVEFSLMNAELNELIANDMATRIGPGVVPPQIVHRVEPEYPTHRRQRVQPAGSVVLDAVISERGHPKIIRVIRSLDWELDEVAIGALEQWIFSPAMKDGKPVKVRMNIAVNFQSR